MLEQKQMNELLGAPGSCLDEEPPGAPRGKKSQTQVSEAGPPPPDVLPASGPDGFCERVCPGAPKTSRLGWLQEAGDKYGDGSVCGGERGSQVTGQAVSTRGGRHSAG